MNELDRRRIATEKTLAKYRKRAFDWRGITCLHLARTQLRNMGHKPPMIPRFYSATGAVRRMKEHGFASISDVLDSLGLERIAPAMMLVGDLATLPGQEGLDAIVVSAGGPMLGWREDHLQGIVPIVDAIGSVSVAWRL